MTYPTRNTLFFIGIFKVTYKRGYVTLSLSNGTTRACRTRRCTYRISNSRIQFLGGRSKLIFAEMSANALPARVLRFETTNSRCCKASAMARNFLSIRALNVVLLTICLSGALPSRWGLGTCTWLGNGLKDSLRAFVAMIKPAIFTTFACSASPMRVLMVPT